MSAGVNDLHRLPGLFRRWELVQVLEPGRNYHLEAAGRTADGADLMAVYRSDKTGDTVEVGQAGE